MSKIIVSKIKNKLITCKYDGFDLERISVSEEGSQSILGNIYIAKVKNIVKNINAAFVEIADGTMCYLELKDNVKPIFMNYKKDDIIKQGDEILVEVIKEAQQKKDPVVTACISVKGEHIILAHGKNFIGVSSKIRGEETRKGIVSVLNKYITEDYGYIVRTKAAEVSGEILEDEAEKLAVAYKELLDKAKYSTCFSCILKKLPAYICDIKEMLDKSVEEIVAEDDKLFADISNMIDISDRENGAKLRHYSDATLSLSKLYSVETRIEELLKERVWLKSGGNIIIQRTDALTAIDVNTSKAINIKGENEKTFLKVNVEAAREIARQLSLRNIGGIIIVDFINMKEKKSIKKLLDVFKECLDSDYVKATVVDMTKLNLVEVTRQKIKQPLANYVYDMFR